MLTPSQQRITRQSSDGKVIPTIRIRVASKLPASPAALWAQLTTVESLKYICKPWVVFWLRGHQPLPTTWREGDAFPLFLWLFGVVPGGRHTIRLERIDPHAFEIQSRESGTIVPVWDHLITLREAAPGITDYTDEVDLYAGVLTPVVAWWAIRFYRHRQRRWRKRLSGG
jgi:hypothetical protein